MNELAMLKTLVQQEQPISVEAIAQTIDADEYEVEEMLEKWFEFLQQQNVGGATHYSFYHSNFCDLSSKYQNLS